MFERRILCSFQEKRQGTSFKGAKERLRNGKGRFAPCRRDYPFYALMDSIVDRYFVILKHWEKRSKRYRISVVMNPGPDTAGHSHSSGSCSFSAAPSPGRDEQPVAVGWTILKGPAKFFP